MTKTILFISAVSLFAAALFINVCDAKGTGKSNYNNHIEIYQRHVSITDTVPPDEVMAIIKTVIHSTDNFNIEAVAALYTPNAVVADDEPPYSWNGPTAGIQWVNAVEQACKDNHLTKLKGTIESVNVFQQSTDNVYIVVPVSYTGILADRTRFVAKGAFTFVLRMINGSWLIKSQVWMPKKGM